MSKNGHISCTDRGEKIKALFDLLKKINLIKYNKRKFSFNFFAPTLSSILGPKIFILDFLQFYLIKVISFIKSNLLVTFSAICV